ncbi:hypothetical protein [Candidatus Magnetominusculus xianensis]|nr:hypothetical protein [Candidatus Magnetominusculus xianensis]MBF0402472.1 hypothetical protein [Nitrospirota bacterium]
MNNSLQDYKFEPVSKSLLFTTSAFKSEKGSVLHSGIYNREMASTFVAAGAAFSYFVVAALSGWLSYIHYAITAVLFAVIYPLSWLYIFRKAAIAVFLDNDNDIAAIAIKGTFRKKKIFKALSQLKDIRVTHREIETGNPDGVAFVEKIALQHGTVIPGFGAAQHIYSVELVFDDAQITVYSSGDKDKAANVLSGFKDYIFSNFSREDC